MSYDGSLIFDTEINTQGFQTGANKLNSIVGRPCVFKLIEKGFSLVTGSIDKAMGRIDTMEQFSRVMTTVTGDVNATNEALDETTEIVTGTAYGLDFAGRAVQNFVSRGMEIEKSTGNRACLGRRSGFLWGWKQCSFCQRDRCFEQDADQGNCDDGTHGNASERRHSGHRDVCGCNRRHCR